MDTHGRIMNLRCEPPDLAGVAPSLAYKMGHKDARHAAAEIACHAPSDRRKRREAWPDTADQSDDWLDNPRDVRAVLCLGMCLISGALLAIGVLGFAVGKLAGWW